MESDTSNPQQNEEEQSDRCLAAIEALRNRFKRQRAMLDKPSQKPDPSALKDLLERHKAYKEKKRLELEEQENNNNNASSTVLVSRNTSPKSSATALVASSEASPDDDDIDQKVLLEYCGEAVKEEFKRIELRHAEYTKKTTEIRNTDHLDLVESKLLLEKHDALKKQQLPKDNHDNASSTVLADSDVVRKCHVTALTASSKVSNREREAHFVENCPELKAMLDEIDRRYSESTRQVSRQELGRLQSRSDSTATATATAPVPSTNDVPSTSNHPINYAPSNHPPEELDIREYLNEEQRRFMEALDRRDDRKEEEMLQQFKNAFPSTLDSQTQTQTQGISPNDHGTWKKELEELQRRVCLLESQSQSQTALQPLDYNSIEDLRPRVAKSLERSGNLGNDNVFAPTKHSGGELDFSEYLTEKEQQVVAAIRRRDDQKDKELRAGLQKLRMQRDKQDNEVANQMSAASTNAQVVTLVRQIDGKVDGLYRKWEEHQEDRKLRQMMEYYLEEMRKIPGDEDASMEDLLQYVSDYIALKSNGTARKLNVLDSKS